jgi:hypothetical protein
VDQQLGSGQARFVTRVRVVTFKDVNVEEFIRKEGI